MDLLPPKFMSLVFFFQTLSVTLFLLKSFGGCVSFKLCLYFRRQTLVFSCSWRRSTTVARAKRMRFFFAKSNLKNELLFFFQKDICLSFLIKKHKNVKTFVTCICIHLSPFLQELENQLEPCKQTQTRPISGEEVRRWWWWRWWWYVYYDKVSVCMYVCMPVTFLLIFLAGGKILLADEKIILAGGKCFWQMGKLFWQVKKLFWQVGKLF